MMSQLTAPSATGPHPFEVAFLARDVDAIRETLATDVTLRSPVITSPFHGRDEALRVLELCEFVVQMRPLTGLTAFAAELGPRIVVGDRGAGFVRVYARALAVGARLGNRIAGKLVH